MTRTERFWWTAPVVVFLAMLIGVNLARAQDRDPPAATQPIDWRALTATPQSVDLASIAPLEVVHYSWPIRAVDVLPTSAWWLHDFVRITRGASVSADTSTTEAHVRALAKVAAQYRASVAVVMAPYHHASWSDGDPRRTDATYWPWWSARLTVMRGWVEAEGATVGCVIFDCERFVLKSSAADLKSYPGWNEAARHRYDEAYDAVKAVFGQSCYVEWYSRGWYRPIGTTRIQRMAGPYSHFDLSERGDGVSAVVTRPDWTEPAIASVYETAMRSSGESDPLAIWLWMGSGYRYTAGTLSVASDWDYGLPAARALARLRTSFPGRLRAVIFYPSPGINRHWLRHFAEYAK